VTDTASDATGDEPKGLVGGRPYRRTDYTEPGKLFARGKMTVEGIKARTELSNRRAFRIHRQFNVGAVVVDGEQVRPGAGYRWDPKALDDVPQSYTLIRA
jgi:hypothetical protein